MFAVTKKSMHLSCILLLVFIGGSSVLFAESVKPESNKPDVLPQRLEKIIIPDIVFNDADIFSVIRFLNRLSKRYDPDKTGVSVIAGFDMKTNKNLPKITMKYTKVSMKEILQRLCQTAGLKYKIEKNAVILLPDPAAKPILTEKESENAALTKKLKSIIIPRVDFKDLTIETAVRQLREQSKKLDPDGVGVNIILKNVPGSDTDVIDMVLAKKNLYQVIYFFCKATDLKFRIEKDVVVISK